MNSPSFPEGPGSVSGAPNLPDGFTGTFTSRYVDTGGLRQHVVTGGDGPPLLLVHGWPQTWYAWRLVMPGAGPRLHRRRARPARVRAVRQARGRLRHRHPGRRPGRADGRARAPAVRRGRPRHRDVDRLRPGRRPPRPGRPAGGRRDPPSGRVPVPAAVRQRAPEQRAVALRVQPARRGQRPARHRPGRDLLRLAVRHQGRPATARLRGPALHRHPRRQPRSAARQLRDLPRAGCHHRAEPAAHDPAAERCPCWASAASTAWGNRSRTP